MAQKRVRPTNDDDDSGRVRLQRVMADAGVAARRACEEMIEAGRVSVNGEISRRLPIFVDPRHDRIVVDGRPLKAVERKLYLMVYKPERMLVTNADEPEFDRATIMEIVDHPAKARLFPVGRLDFETAGLVIMTNDGELANLLTHPRFNVPKVYEALIKGQVDQAALDAVRVKIRGMRKRDARESGVEGPVAGGAVPEFEFVKYNGSNTVIRVTLVEARNRELRDVLEFLGMPIKKLTRTGLGGLTLSGVAPAQWRELAREEIHLLKRSRGGYRPPVRKAPVEAPGPANDADGSARPARPRFRPTRSDQSGNRTPVRRTRGPRDASEGADRRRSDGERPPARRTRGPRDSSEGADRRRPDGERPPARRTRGPRDSSEGADRRRPDGERPPARRTRGPRDSSEGADRRRPDGERPSQPGSRPARTDRGPVPKNPRDRRDAPPATGRRSPGRGDGRSRGNDRSR